MDDLRAGLVAAGRAVSEAQQEAEGAKRNFAQQEAALAGRHGASVDVLKRLGEVSSKLDSKESQLEVRLRPLALGCWVPMAPPLRRAHAPPRRPPGAES